MELRGLVPNSYIHVSVSDLYISMISLHIWLQQNRQTDPIENPALRENPAFSMMENTKDQLYNLYSVPYISYLLLYRS
jgi:hypothetical protein